MEFDLLKADDYGNRLMIQSRVHIWIFKKNGNRKRIFNINRSADRLEVTCQKSKIFKPDSYGFCEEVLKMASQVKNLLVQETVGEREFTKVTATYLIPINDVLDKGYYADFLRETGFEKQIFITRTELKKYTVKL